MVNKSNTPSDLFVILKEYKGDKGILSINATFKTIEDAKEYIKLKRDNFEDEKCSIKIAKVTSVIAVQLITEIKVLE